MFPETMNQWYKCNGNEPVKVEIIEEGYIARQNPQAPPTLAVPPNDDLNNQIQNQMTAYTHREQRRVSKN